MYKLGLIAVCVLFFALDAFAANFVHPLDFKGSKKEKQQVIGYIVENVKSTYEAIGMDQASTLRMMEKNELDSFRKLTKVKNRKLLDKVINTYCGIGMCGYNTLLMMYNNENKASKKSLTW